MLIHGKAEEDWRIFHTGERCPRLPKSCTAQNATFLPPYFENEQLSFRHISVKEIIVFLIGSIEVLMPGYQKKSGF